MGFALRLNFARLFLLYRVDLYFAHAPLAFVMTPLNILIANYNFAGCLLELINVAVCLDIAHSLNFYQFLNRITKTDPPALFR
jgi:hypothetical protein